MLLVCGRVSNIGVCCCSEKLIDVMVKSDYLMQEMEKNGPNKFIFAIFKAHNSDTN